MMKSFAIVVVCYERIEGIKRLIKGLEKVDFNGRKDINLIFSIDYSGSNEVEKFANEYEWIYGPKFVRVFSENQGLKKHILKCGNYTNEFDIVSILEDDIYVSNSFYNFAYQSAEFYWDDENIAGISLYGFQKNWLNWLIRFEAQRGKYDNYFLKVAQSWGQVWTKSKWDKFTEWYLHNKTFKTSDDIPEYLNEWPETSWLKYHDKYCIEKNKYFVYPYIGFTTNFSDAGVHSRETVNDHQVEMQFDKTEFKFSVFDENSIRYDEYMNREGLGVYLGVKEDELTVDLYSTQNRRKYKRYVLTLKNLDYKIIKSYSLSLRPIELSVIENLSGDQLYLYDTKVVDKNRKTNSDYNLLEYSIRSQDGMRIFLFSLKLLIKNLKSKIARGFKKIVY